MKIGTLAGVACAALMGLSLPAHGATSPQLPSAGAEAAGGALSAFYASRHGAPLWLKGGPDGSAARELIAVLQRAPLDGMLSGPAIAQQAQALLARAQTGDSAALAATDSLLSAAWVQYVEALQTPPAGMTYGGTPLQPSSLARPPHPRSPRTYAASRR